jgi:hypothetical protein
LEVVPSTSKRKRIAPIGICIKKKSAITIEANWKNCDGVMPEPQVMRLGFPGKIFEK